MTSVACGQPAPDDRDLAGQVRVLEPVVEAAPLERVVHLTGAVAGDHDDRWGLGADRAELGTEIVQSLSTSSRNASNSSSARSTSSTSSTLGVVSSACSSGRATRKRRS